MVFDFAWSMQESQSSETEMGKAESLRAYQPSFRDFKTFDGETRFNKNKNTFLVAAYCNNKKLKYSFSEIYLRYNFRTKRLLTLAL